MSESRGSNKMNIEDENVELQLRPPKEQRFNKDVAKEIIANILSEELLGKTYNKDDAEKICLQIGSKVKSMIKGKFHSNYKLVCHIRLGEQRGAGIRIVARCLWDSENDGVASTSFENDSIFCVVSVFAVYFY